MLITFTGGAHHAKGAKAGVAEPRMIAAGKAIPKPGMEIIFQYLTIRFVLPYDLSIVHVPVHLHHDVHVVQVAEDYGR